MSKNKTSNLKRFWTVIKASVKSFSQDDVMGKSASLAFYTLFSLGPLFFVILLITGYFMDPSVVENKVYEQITEMIGANSSQQVQEVIKNASLGSAGGWTKIIGMVTLLVGATTMFGNMQDSINHIWGLKPNPKKGFLRLIMTRLLSFGMIASLSFLLLVSFLVSSILNLFYAELNQNLSQIAVGTTYLLNLGFSLIFTTLLFLIIFKILPDAKIRWKDVWVGAIATAILFLIGKEAIVFYLGTNSLATTYGAAGSLVVLLLWVYYSATILYFGAEFTKEWAIQRGKPIYPNAYAVAAQTIEIRSENKSLQEVRGDMKSQNTETSNGKE